MADDPENSDFIVVHDGLPRIGPDGENLTSPAATVSESPEPAPDRPRGPGRPTRKSDFNDTLDPLRALPELRSIPWYEGKELPADKATESTRVQTRGACLLASRGRVIDPPCNHCLSGVGRFSQCIALEDWFHGACATCQLATRGNLCSLRKEKVVAVKSESEQQNSPAAEMPVVKRGRRKRPESSSTPNEQPRTSSANLPQSQSEPREHAPAASSTTQPDSNSPFVQPPEAVRPPDEYISQFGRPSQPLKRKRETLQGTSVYRPYVSPYAPLDLPNRLASSLPNTPIVPSTPNMIIPANIARDQSAYNNYIRERESQQNGTTRHQPVNQAPKSGFVAINGNGYRNSPAIIETAGNTRESQGKDRDATESLSPSAQLLNQPLQSPSPEPPASRKCANQEPTRMTTRNTQKKNPHSNGKVAAPNSSRTLEPPDTALIDSLPRRKQKQIFNIIGGLQSGIRSCQQQAESMQKQLDLLQAALGIDGDDDKDVSMNG